MEAHTTEASWQEPSVPPPSLLWTVGYQILFEGIQPVLKVNRRVLCIPVDPVGG